MHFHSKHDIEGCCVDHADQPALATLLATLDRMEILIMSAVQDSINAAVAVIGELDSKVSDLSGQVSALTSQVLDLQSASSADTSGLDAAVAAAQAALNPPTPAAPEVPPADQSQSDPAPADVPAPDQGIPSVPLA